MSSPTTPTDRPARHPVRRRGRVLRGVVAVALLVAAVGVGPYLWVRWAARDHVHPPDQAPTAPVALVLGAGLTATGQPSPFLAARLDVAAHLLENRRVRAVLVSGDNRVAGYDEPTAMRDYLVAHGVPADVVVRDFAGRDTYDSCSRARRIFGADRVLVVTQTYHLDRAVATCRALGLDADGVGDDTARRFTGTWRSGALREVPASIKTVWDLASGRDPVLGPVEPGLADALAGAPSTP